MNNDNRHPYLKAAGLACACLLSPLFTSAQNVAGRPNVLFIAVDDLRPQLGCYGYEQIKSPNIDRLAGRGLLFERAYCQQAICMASRASLLSGYRPDKGQIYQNNALFTHVPMIISAPGMKSRGERTAALTEFVDIYPTLAEYCGLDLPAHLEGTSMVPLLNNPGQAWKPAAFSQWPSGNLMGYSIRSGRWRYTEWIEANTGTIKDRELYDHENGPLVTRNQASDPALADTVRELSQLLDKGQGWKAIKREVEKNNGE